MGNYTIFRSSKILGEAGKQHILQQMFGKFYFNLDLESFSEQVFSENCRRLPLLNFVYNMEPVQACIALNVISITLNITLKLISNQCN